VYPVISMEGTDKYVGWVIVGWINVGWVTGDMYETLVHQKS